jgi:hypothetical protein
MGYDARAAGENLFKYDISGFNMTSNIQLNTINGGSPRQAPAPAPGKL